MSSSAQIVKTRWLGSIRGQLMFVIALFALGMTGLVAFQTWRSVEEIYSERRQQLRSVVEAAEKAVEGQYAAFQAGRISEAEAQERAKAVVRSMRYNGAGYFFIQDQNIVTIVHGARPDQEGVAGADQKDPTGKYFSREMHRVATEEGEGFVDYQYAKPGAPLDQPSPKLSFVKYFKPWRWTVGTGVYIDDLNARIRNELLIGSGVALALCLAIGLVAWRIVARLAGRLGALSAATTALAQGDLSREPPRAAGDDEVGRMTQALQVFYDAARARAALETTALSARKEAESARAAFDAERMQKERSLEEAARALGLGLERLAAGNLAGGIEVPFDGALDKLRLDFNAALQKLRHTILSIRENAQGIRNGVEEIARASDDLSTRTEQQAAQHEKLAGALEQITTTLKSSAEGVRNASALVSVADQDAREGSIVVKDAVRAMDEISDSSEKISRIIGVIDEIAFQTNLLALNAGVEAARAGDAGKGFAVVASEVRALAQRSADAAKEIKTLIFTSTTQVANGVQLVTKTGGGLESIISRVSEINHLVADLARGAQEQSSGLQDVNGSVSEMDRVTQQNATMAEQANAASRSLAQETAKLVELISVFDVGGSGDLRDELRKAAPHAFASRPAMRPRAGSRPMTA